MGTFITFEGSEGCGKTSVIKLVAEQLKISGIEVVCTKESEDEKLSEKIYDILKTSNNIDHITESLLYATCRNHTLNNIIIPSLEKDKVVLCERFIDSSYVYQGIVKNLGLDQIMAINSLVVKNYMPELTIYIDAAPEKCLSRSKKNGKRKSDLESLDFFNKVRDAYLMIGKIFKDRIITINGNQPLEKVAKDAYEAIDVFLRSKKNEGIF